MASFQFQFICGSGFLFHNLNGKLPLVSCIAVHFMPIISGIMGLRPVGAHIIVIESDIFLPERANEMRKHLFDGLKNKFNVGNYWGT